MNHAESAASRFAEGFACSQAILSAFASDLGLDSDAALRVSAGFGGGLGRTGGTCGAATGACMAIGLKYGATSGQDRQAKEKTYAVVRTFMGRFKARHGSVTCRELLGCDISTPEGFEEMKRKGLHGTVCAGLVRSAADILDEVLRETEAT